MKKKEFKAGDKIKFVGPVVLHEANVTFAGSPRHAEVVTVNFDNLRIKTIFGDDTEAGGFIHPRQVTHRIVPKKRRREWWAFENDRYGLCFIEMGSTQLHASKEVVEKSMRQIANENPGINYQLIRLREVRK